MNRLGLVSLLALAACAVDKDGDGYTSDVDCNDDNPSLHTSTPEICDFVDNDCNGVVDDGVLEVYYLDSDGDGYGSDGSGDDSTKEDCSRPDGYVYREPGDTASVDCDDSSATVNPSAVEVCDDADTDENCDGVADQAGEDGADPIGLSTWHLDADGDGYGDSLSSQEACDAPSDHVADRTDCDDSNGQVSPGAEEVVGDAGNLDENCDNAILCYYDTDKDGYGAGDPVLVEVGSICMQRDDEDFDGTHSFSRLNTDCDDSDGAAFPGSASSEPGSQCMRDSDGDGYGDISVSEEEQDQGIIVGSDCNDSDGSIGPGMSEVVADETDQNCDGQEICYVDSDGDQFGSALTISSADADCQDENESVNSDDCSDTDEHAYPGAAENESATECRRDADGDGYGDSTGTEDIAPGTDCDDSMAEVSPAAVELCSTDYDDNCDSEINESSAEDVSVFYLDGDGDSYGESSSVLSACSLPAGYVSDSSDCDDADPATHPGAAEEIANGADNDCDGYESCYTDADGDGYGVDSVTYSSDEDCYDGVEASNADDCDDGSTSTYPGAAGFEDSAECMSDSDGDGWGDADPLTGVTSGRDCDDGDSSVNPDAQETVADGIDQDCNNVELCYLDADDDGFGGQNANTVASEDFDCDDENESVSFDDCNDLDAARYPDASEYCNGEDDDCDGSADEGVNSTAPLDAFTWYGDSDGDGYGSDSFTLLQCEQPAGYVEDTDDCNDLEALVNPLSEEVCFDGVDNDCDGTIDGVESCEVSANDADASVQGPDGYALAGYDISTGDLDGDGVQDLVLGSPGAAGYGSVYVIYGPVDSSFDLSDASGDEVVVIEGDVSDMGSSGLGLGTAVELVDLNKDGQDDLLLSAPGSDDQGVVYLVYSPVGDRLSSPASLVDGVGGMDLASAMVSGDEEGVEIGCSISNAGDVNGDEYDDVMIGTCDDGSTTGYAALLYGQQENLSGEYVLASTGIDDSDASAVSSAVFSGVTLEDHFGETVERAGDINGDGISDMLFGAYAGLPTDQGTAYLLYGDSTPFSGTLSAASDMSAASSGDGSDDFFGEGLGSAGDVNGDGYTDFLASAPSSDTGRGYARLFLGAVDQLAGNLSEFASIHGETDNDFFGADVSGIGDVNGDSYGDIIVSASGAGTIGTVYVFYGPLEGTIDLGSGEMAAGKINGSNLSSGLNSNFGARLSVNDMDGDGVHDIIAASALHDSASGTDIGSVFLFTTVFD